MKWRVYGEAWLQGSLKIRMQLNEANPERREMIDSEAMDYGVNTKR